MSAVRAGALHLERTFAERGWGVKSIFHWGPAAESDDGDSSDDDEHDGHDEANPESATHPAYAAHFTAPMYCDAAGAFTPFGNDEGADAFLDLAEDRPALERGTLAYVFRDDAELVEHELAKRASRNREDLYLRVIGWGFGLIRLTGQIDSHGLETVKLAVRRQAELWGDRAPEYQRMLADLESFPNEPRPARHELS